jgi:cytochrome c553
LQGIAVGLCPALKKVKKSLMNRQFTALCLLMLSLVLGGCTLDTVLQGFVAAEPMTTSVGDAQRGEQLYRNGANGAPACVGCHTLATSAYSIGPSLVGLAERAGQQVNGLDADAYIRQSILTPGAYVLNGYRYSMYADYANHLSEQDLADLIAFLQTL